MNKKPFVIAIDGPDGSGKSTIAKHLQAFMIEKYGPTEIVSMLGSGEVGKQIRQVFLHDANPLEPGVEALWLASACAETIYYTVQNLQAEGKNVILDRYISSYYAYQCSRSRNDYAEFIYDQILKPLIFKKQLDLYIHCEISLEAAEARIESRGNQDNNDKFDLTTKASIKHGFDEFYTAYMGKKRCLNCERPEHLVKDSAERLISEFLK